MKGDPILVVENEENIRALLQEVLLAEGYDCDAAVNGANALEKLRCREYHLVLTDILMPVKSGMDLLKEARILSPDTAFIMVTAVNDTETAIEAMRLGADNYLLKPFNVAEVAIGVQKALHRRRLMLENRDYQQNLERRVQERTEQLRDTLTRLEGSYQSTLDLLRAALDTRDVETYAHSERVTRYTLRLAREVGMVGRELEILEKGVFLHDIGKIGIPDAILLRPGKLTDGEMEIMKTHAELGMRLLSRVDFLHEVAEIVYSHQERFDGTGYPRRLRGDQIPRGARVFAVVDALDAMTSDRPYRRAVPFSIARQEIARASGRQFDPNMVEAFLRVPEGEWAEVRRQVDLYKNIEKIEKKVLT
ncbi:MAG TPA: HD domain-containing phosphohydrolase [Nitrospiria bacterium]|nr:HD domain-containing phosphohydrolase [Nitrospiria bacterium]